VIIIPVVTALTVTVQRRKLAIAVKFRPNNWPAGAAERNLNDMRTNILVHVIAGLVLAACSSNGSADINTASAPAANTPGAMAIAVVAELTGAAPEQITLLSEEAVDFSDSSLGCPQPGMAYMQVITPGHQVMAEYAGEIYDVRVAGGRAVICDNVATGVRR